MDVSFLEPVFSAPGPYATVCVDVTHTTENADTEVDLRVRAVAGRLTGQGVVVPRAALPGGVPVAAVLRYTDASTPSAP